MSLVALGLGMVYLGFVQQLDWYADCARHGKFGDCRFLVQTRINVMYSL